MCGIHFANFSIVNVVFSALMIVFSYLVYLRFLINPDHFSKEVLRSKVEFMIVIDVWESEIITNDVVIDDDVADILTVDVV